MTMQTLQQRASSIAPERDLNHPTVWDRAGLNFERYVGDELLRGGLAKRRRARRPISRPVAARQRPATDLEL